MAGLLASGPTTVIEPEPSRDHTERLLARAGVRISRDGDRIELTAARRARARRHPRARRPVLGRVPHRRRGARQGLADRDRPT